MKLRFMQFYTLYICLETDIFVVTM